MSKGRDIRQLPKGEALKSTPTLPPSNAVHSGWSTEGLINSIKNLFYPQRHSEQKEKSPRQQEVIFFNTVDAFIDFLRDFIKTSPQRKLSDSYAELYFTLPVILTSHERGRQQFFNHLDALFVANTTALHLPFENSPHFKIVIQLPNGLLEVQASQWKSWRKSIEKHLQEAAYTVTASVRANAQKHMQQRLARLTEKTMEPVTTSTTQRALRATAMLPSQPPGSPPRSTPLLSMEKISPLARLDSKTNTAQPSPTRVKRLQASKKQERLEEEQIMRLIHEQKIKVEKAKKTRDDQSAFDDCALFYLENQQSLFVPIITQEEKSEVDDEKQEEAPTPSQTASTRKTP